METSWRSLLLLVALTARMHICTGFAAFSFCTNAQPVSDNEIAFMFNEDEGSTQCTCELTPKAQSTYLKITMSVDRKGQSTSDDNVPGKNTPPGESGTTSNVTCEPFAAINVGMNYQLSQCAAKGMNDERDPGAPSNIAAPENFLLVMGKETTDFLVKAGSEPVKITLHNHHRRSLRAAVYVTVEEGQVDIACHPQEDSEVWAADKCPCDDSGMVPAGAGGGRGPIIGDVGTGQTGLIVGLVCVAIFILVIALIAGICFWRKRQGGEKDLEPAEVDNAAYSASTTASRASGMDRHPPESGPIYSNVSEQKPGSKQRPIPFDADPELDLSLRTSPKKQGKPNGGSTDSGVYTMPNDKQAPPNNNYPYANVPAPLGPDQMYNPMLAKQPSVASLTGQGALHGSVDHLNPADVVYAKPNKRKQPDPNPAPTRSASTDALNQRPDGGLAQTRSRSHNTSMASMASTHETDV